ncbi:uncharacterized protein Z520_09247 [Fonsecaea multimorphosa CBS 102226]|uniref:NAD(P)-binding domain-containing protein n=1 Tax=Fonsecaea multimorphosa CBS 102226 TaxID=1442371 RepID=A0A0D2JNP9_9EURO|nr:uncharacterized protein Z520_09247 [Fonsecaea multimorphosa CBS 102226]KIX94937.1 hypothetical protein Z520_09247 [Fonsecaea multimorphosa CBS 102226]OAL20588.1 hypothetical protein AYO22_08597 [Fonsecaea multimorphosa]
MKAILTGSTGFIGGEILNQCIAHPQITSIVALSRRALPEPAASSSKVKVVILQDFTNYPDSVLDELRDADFCIWALGTYTGGAEVEAGYPLAFCEAIAKARIGTTTKMFRMVYLSGMFVINDQNASLWFFTTTRKAKGLAETRLLAFSDEQKQNNQNWESYVVRPGGVLHKQTAGLNTATYGNRLVIGVSVLAVALIETALEGNPENKIFHGALVEKGRSALQKAK